MLKAVDPDSSFGKLWLFLRRRETRHLGLYTRWLERQNRRSTLPVLSPEGPFLSLTTYGTRLRTVHLTLESIAAGILRPSRLLLWVDDAVLLRERPDTLRRLEDRGLEIKLTENLGPHTKYYPSLAERTDPAAPLVIADDDMLYPRDWLSRLLAVHWQHPSLVICHRAHSITMAPGGIAPYAEWTRCVSAAPSLRHFATGVSGTVLPPALLDGLERAGTNFKLSCPKADDIWLHLQAIRAGIPTRQVSPWQQNYPMLPGTQVLTLMSSNVSGAQNDAQISRCYTPHDVSLLQQEPIA